MWRDRAEGPGNVASVGWHTQPAIMTKPGNSKPGRSKDGSQSKWRTDSTLDWMKLGAQVSLLVVTA